MMSLLAFCGGVSAAVFSMEGSIGYAVLADAISGGLSQVKLKNKAGQAVVADPRSVSFALMELGGNLNDRGVADLMDASSTYAWPIAGRSLLQLFIFSAS